jgi:hypothetical protein
MTMQVLFDGFWHTVLEIHTNGKRTSLIVETPAMPEQGFPNPGTLRILPHQLQFIEDSRTVA